MSIDETLLDEKLAELEKARAWSPRVVSKLEGLIRTGDDYSLYRVNPLRFAAEKSIAEAEAIDLFLYSAKLGLFEMNWHLICPTCGDMVKSFRTLKTLHSHFYCSLCRIEADAALDDQIQISFTISPPVRPIAFHSPDSLSVEDFHFKYHFSREGRFPGGGPLFVEAAQQLAKILTYLEPKERKDFAVEISPGVLLGNDFINDVGFVFSVTGDNKIEPQRLPVKFVGSTFEPQSIEIAPGKTVFEFENLTDRKGAIILVNLPPNYQSPLLEFDFFLTGKRLLTTQTFRDLFRSETIQGTEGIGVKDLTVLFTDLKGSTALYDRIGDLKAYYLVRQHFDSLGRVVSKHAGAIVKTIGDAVLATFLNPVDAIKAALEMLEEIELFNRGLDNKEIILKIGIHKGALIAVTLNDRLDYFGQTVNIASRVQGLADSEEIYVTHDAYSHPGVRELLEPCDIAPGKARLKGIEEEMQVYRITHRKLAAV